MCAKTNDAIDIMCSCVVLVTNVLNVRICAQKWCA